MPVKIFFGVDKIPNLRQLSKNKKVDKRNIDQIRKETESRPRKRFCCIQDERGVEIFRATAFTDKKLIKQIEQQFLAQLEKFKDIELPEEITDIARKSSQSEVGKTTFLDPINLVTAKKGFRKIQSLMPAPAVA